MKLFSKKSFVLLLTSILLLTASFNQLFSQVVSRQEIVTKIENLNKSTNKSIHTLSTQIAKLNKSQDVALNESIVKLNIAVEKLKVEETPQQSVAPVKDDSQLIAKLEEINNSIKQLNVVPAPSPVIETVSDDEESEDCTTASSFGVGADFVSRYVWRGLDIAATPSIQPTIEYNNGGFTVGLWGAYTISNMESKSDELDLYFGYTFETESGDFGISVVDYYFPNSGSRLGDFKDGGGGNTIEGILTYGGTDSFPISLLVGVNFYNDPGYNTYFEVGYSSSFQDVDLSLFVGATPGSTENSGYYGTDKFALINVGLTASKELKITNDFSLAIFSSFIINPNDDIAHLVFGISL